MALTPNGLVTISGSPSGGEQPTQNAGATMVDGVIVPAAGFIGIGSGAAQVVDEIFGVVGNARVSNVLAVAGSPVGAEKLFVGGDARITGSAIVLSNLGVGAAPAYKFDVQHNSSSAISARIQNSNSTGKSGIQFDNQVSTASGTVHYDNSLAAFVVGANAGTPTRIISAGVRAITINTSQKVLIGTDSEGASLLRVNDDSIEIMTAKTPASAAATGTTGQIAWDANYFYVCTATNTWRRVAHATW